MHLLLSGEGVTDMGGCNNAQGRCSSDNYQVGPMGYVVDKLVESVLGYDYSHLDYDQVTFVSERFLSEHRLPATKKNIALRGKKRAVETQYFYHNARALASIAKQLGEEIGDSVVAVFFRDADGTCNAGRGNWRDKVSSIDQGFGQQNYQSLGVAMVPNPKSEAWFMCALKNNPYQHCATLELSSGNDNAPDALKAQLQERLNGDASARALNSQILAGQVDVFRIDMPSFNHFKQQLVRAVQAATS